MADAPIVVPASATQDQVWTAIRDLLKIAGSALVMRGYLQDSWVEPGVGALLILGPVIWSQLKTRSNHAKLWLLARFTPDAIGQAEPKK
jgi:hypothetical protein